MPQKGRLTVPDRRKLTSYERYFFMSGFFWKLTQPSARLSNISVELVNGFARTLFELVY